MMTGGDNPSGGGDRKPAPFDELDHLLAAAAEGDLEFEERQRLGELLVASGENRRRYLDCMMVHGFLEWEQGHAAERSSVRGRRALDGPTSPAAERGLRRWWGRRGGMVVAFLAAVGVAAASAVWVRVVATREETVAIIAGSTGAVWDSSDIPTTVGTEVAAGRLRLREGSATVRMHSGASLTIRGRTELALAGRDRCMLSQGKVEVVVPKGSAGIVLDTPRVRFVDVGTKFRVEVEGIGRTSLQVDEGSIEARLPDGATVVVTAGRAIEFDDRGLMHELEVGKRE